MEYHPHLRQRSHMSLATSDFFLRRNRRRDRPPGRLHTRAALFLVAFPLMGAACSPRSLNDFYVATPKVHSGPTTKGHVIVLGGVENASTMFEHPPEEAFCPMLLARGFSYEVYPWEKIYGSLASNSGFTDENRKRAYAVAKRLREWRDAQSTPVYLVATSGSGWFAKLLCEAKDDKNEDILPPKFFEKILLISTALAANEDLQGMISRTRCGLWNYYSSRDDVLDGLEKNWLTKTVVRQPAGLHGFTPTVRRNANGNLHELPWDADAERLGNAGGHVGCCAKSYSETYLLPLFEACAPVLPKWEGNR